MRLREWAPRLAVTLVVALAVVVVAVAPALVPSSGSGSATVATPEYDPARIATRALPAEGEVRPDVDGRGKVVLVDAGHANRFDRSDVDSLVRGVTRAGASVRFYRGGRLNESLADADAFVVLDPGSEYAPHEVAAVRRFSDAGGRVFLGAEPDRVRVSSGLLGSSVTTVESRVTTLSSAYGVHVGTDYLYNVETADGNYRNVLVEPRGSDSFAGVERMAMYTAAAVHTRTGQPVLFTTPGTHESGTDRTDAFPVAAVDGNLLVAGDTTFLAATRYNVADNEAAVASVVEFLLGGERVPTDDGNETDSADGNETDSDAGATGTAGSEHPANETADAGAHATTSLGPAGTATGVAALARRPGE